MKKREWAESDFREYAARFLEAEKGEVPLKGGWVRIALLYPNVYSVGMANLGFQTAYRLFNAHPELRCERLFCYGAPFKGIDRTLESGERLDRFDWVGISLSYELDIQNILLLLGRSRIPVLACERDDRSPILIAGGAVASLNPSPLLPFIDGLLVGEGEDIFYALGTLMARSRREGWRRSEVLGRLALLPGFYVPSVSKSVKKHSCPEFEREETFTPLVTPFSHFGEMFVVEVSRGCPRGCYFCAGQKAYSPYRFRSADILLTTIRTHNPGAPVIGLEGAGLSDYPDLEKVCSSLAGMGLRFSVSSLRPDRIRPELVGLLEKGGVKSLTMAPEAGSESLRRDIGKPMKNGTLIDAARMLGDSAVEQLKLYFLIGLPGETESDITEMSALVEDMAGAFIRKGKKKQLRLSVNAFVPKPHTEFQWAPMADEKTLLLKREKIMHGVTRSRVAISAKSGREELLQGVLSQGDAETGLCLWRSMQNGTAWKSQCTVGGKDWKEVLLRERDPGEAMPWDFIGLAVSKEVLEERYIRFKKKRQ